jgi:rSAM/selenodomain-associated transferase 2
VLLQTLRRLRPNLEIIVIDGGSRDGTPSIAKAGGANVITAPRGRALQMNAGARIARGSVLWFLHADLEVPLNAIEQIRAALASPRVAGGCFRLRFPRPEWIYRIGDSLGNLGVDLFGFALGDHGIFCWRDQFNRIGGYRDLPILEDADLYRRLRRQGAMQQVRAEIVSDPRAFEKHGRYRTTGVYFVILALYVLGFPIQFLNRIYRRFVRIESEPCRPTALAPAARWHM